MKRALGSLATVALILGWFVFLRPQFWGGPATYVLVSGDSMVPTLQNGDFVVARDSPYEIGDIVVFRVPEDDVGGGSLVIHRLVGGSASEGFVMQGDNRDQPDHWRPRPADLEGELWVRIPYGGRVMLMLRSPLVIAGLAGLAAFFFIVLRRDTDEGSETGSEGDEAGQDAAPASRSDH